jgi:GNAT superfamily N-acetyltransferase
MGCGRIGGVIEARRIPGTADVARALVAAMVDELDATYTPDFPPPPSPTAEQMSPPGGTFVVLYEGETPVAGGGVRPWDEGTCEIKRMYVLPEARSRGLARRLLGELEQAGRDLGYRRVRLDTGRLQPHALALYAATGYRDIPDYNNNPYASYWGEKEL